MSQFFRRLRVPRPRVQVRQGDVLLIPVDEIPATATLVPRDGNRVILAYGEATGHAHAIDTFMARLLEDEGVRYLRVDDTAVLDHEEHAPITVAPGIYRVVIQREFVPPDPELVFDGRPAITSRPVVD